MDSRLGFCSRFELCSFQEKHLDEPSYKEGGKGVLRAAGEGRVGNLGKAE